MILFIWKERQKSTVQFSYAARGGSSAQGKPGFFTSHPDDFRLFDEIRAMIPDRQNCAVYYLDPGLNPDAVFRDDSFNSEGKKGYLFDLMKGGVDLKKYLSFFLVLLLLLSLTACGGSKSPEKQSEKQAEKQTEKKEEKQTEKQTENKTEKTEKQAEKQTEALTEAPTEAPTEPPAPAYTMYDYEYGCVRIAVPEELTQPPADDGKALTFSDPEGLWTVRFEPLSVNDLHNRHDNLKGTFEQLASFGYYQNVTAEQDRSAEFADGKFKVTYYALERNPDWNEASQGYTTSYTQAVAFYLYDFGDTLIGPWGGLEVCISAPEKTTDPIGPILEDEQVQILTGLLAFVESNPLQDVSFPGVTAHVPARWQTGTDNDHTLWLTVQGETAGSVFFTSDVTADPKTAAGYITPDYETYEYGGRQWYGAVRTTELSGETQKSMELFTEFTQYHALCMRLNLNEWTDDQDFKAFVEADTFKNVMEMLELDPDAFHNPEDDMMDTTGFECNNIGEISAYTGTETDIRIPAVIGENTITGINTNLFKDNTSITSVTISEGITYIEPCAFQNCTSLKSVVLPNSLATIDNEAFSGCTALESVAFGTGLVEINGNAFFGCSALGDVILPGTVKTIGSSAFREAGSGAGRFECPADGTVYSAGALGSASFDTVVFGPNADISAGNTLSGFHGTSVQVGEGCTRLGDFFASDPYYEDTQLKEVILPSTIKEIGQGAFSGRKGLTQIDLTGVETLGNSAFYSTGLVNITVPGTVKNIPDDCFASSPDVMSVILEEGVETIGNYAFSTCGRHHPDDWHYWFGNPEETLAKFPDAVPNGTDPFDRAIDVYLPSTLKSIGNQGFSACFLQGVYMLNVTEPSMLPEIAEDAFASSYVLQVYFTKETIDAYGDQLDDACEALEDVGRVAWYDDGDRIFWRATKFEE